MHYIGIVDLFMCMFFNTVGVSCWHELISYQNVNTGRNAEGQKCFGFQVSPLFLCMLQYLHMDNERSWRQRPKSNL